MAVKPLSGRFRNAGTRKSPDDPLFFPLDAPPKTGPPRKTGLVPDLIGAAVQFQTPENGHFCDIVHTFLHPLGVILIGADQSVPL
jgi:hypothetical protein